MGQGLGRMMAHGPFASVACSCVWCQVPAQLGLAQYRGGGGVLCYAAGTRRAGTGAQHGLVSLPRISQDIRGAPHHILTSPNRHTCPMTHIVPCSPLWAGATTAGPPYPHNPTLFSFPGSPGALGRVCS